VHVSSPKQTSWNVNITKPLSMVLIWRLSLHQNAKRVPFLQRTLTSVRLHNALQWFQNNNYVRYTKFLVKRPSNFLSKDSHGNEWYRIRCAWSTSLLWNGQRKTKIYHLYAKTWKLFKVIYLRKHLPSDLFLHCWASSHYGCGCDLCG